ncbi:hypothetical protein L873DRAFT_1797133 [Choiromyces venosus 120613-1]|uniref:HTH psq-type domain-containing protein n=1 Tax=Choiromyces venosus 120613-1 TaxID=1336337 RepID=A0A3N4K9Q2_9PEZI|nr:hypothetical protein L873DRAFT_1797133 [Choiromyces venosus 120613-1]
MPKTINGKRRESRKLECIEVLELQAQGFTHHQIADRTTVSKLNVAKILCKWKVM